MAHGLSGIRGMWDLPGPGIEPMPPALAGGFLTTATPGKSRHPHFKDEKIKTEWLSNLSKAKQL